MTAMHTEMANALSFLAMDAVEKSGRVRRSDGHIRPSIRLSALMKQRVIYVMTHDSIGLGEDGATGLWRQYVGTDGEVIGLDQFGASAPGPDVYTHFGMTAERVVDTVSGLLSDRAAA